MHHAQRLLYKRLKVFVCTGLVASAANLSAQTPWQSSPATPASLNTGTNYPLPATGNEIPSQKPVVNRYTSQAPAQFPPQARPPQLNTPQLNTLQLNTPQNSLQYPPGTQASYPQLYGAQPTLQRPSQFGQIPQNAGQNGLPQYPSQYQPQFATTGQSSVSPPAMVPFVPNNPSGIQLGAASGPQNTYQAFDLLPPTSNSAAAIGSAPALNIQPSSPAPNVQSLVDALQTQPAQSNANSRSMARDLPGAGQLLPRPQATSASLQNNRNALQNVANNSPTSDDPDAFQGRIPTLADLPVPDLTAIGAGTKHLLVSASQGSSQPFGSSGPEAPNEKVITDIWNTKLVAIVGNERVLAGDMAAVIEPIISQNKAAIRNQEQEKEIRLNLARQLLPEYVRMKALQQQFLRDIVGNVAPKEMQKKKDEIMVKASRAFYDKYVPIELYRRHKVEDLAELEGKLQETKLSLNIMKNHFLVQVLAMQCEDKYVASTFEIPPGDILDYYEKNIDQWQIPARAKWRELVARFDRYPDKEAAREAINNMGNEVFLGGKQFEAVAKDSSSGFTAMDGGNHDWTNKASLKSELIDSALFSLPLRRLSEVFEDEVGYHIIEVLEREAARTQEMSEIQTEIRKTLSDEIRNEKLKDLHAKILLRTPIWTMWPQDIQGSKPLKDIQESE